MTTPPNEASHAFLEEADSILIALFMLATEHRFEYPAEAFEDLDKLIESWNERGVPWNPNNAANQELFIQWINHPSVLNPNA